jgi:DNA helicase HerA-like ATPase
LQRDIITQLAGWKRSKRRKPLLLEGARQVGKTWALKEFGRLYYKNTAYLVFDEHPELNRLFATTKDPRRIIENLTIISGQPILPETTLLVFDEIQEAPEALGLAAVPAGAGEQVRRGGAVVESEEVPREVCREDQAGPALLAEEPQLYKKNTADKKLQFPKTSGG